MKIVNNTNIPRYFSYISFTGSVLKPGGISMDLPLNLIFNPIFNKDFDRGLIKIVLSDEDKKLLLKFLNASEADSQKCSDSVASDAVEQKSDVVQSESLNELQEQSKVEMPVNNIQDNLQTPVIEKNVESILATEQNSEENMNTAGVVSLSDLKERNKRIARKKKEAEKILKSMV